MGSFLTCVLQPVTTEPVQMAKANHRAHRPKLLREVTMLQPMMGDPPFLPLPVTEQFGTTDEEHAPTMQPAMRLHGSVDVGQH